MQIPEKFKIILERDNSLHASTLQAIEQTKLWLDEFPANEFFPEYTRHDNRHNEEVLFTTSELITEAALEVITPQDVSVLIGAILLHDSAMHLTKEGFLSLIDRKSAWRPIPFFYEKEWADEWEDFLAIARRYNQKQLMDIFGEADVIPSRPPNNTNEWTDRDKKLIGEFIRIHHPRIAHHMSIGGVPGKDQSSFEIISKWFPAEFDDLIGIVARSHGIGLRNATAYLEEKRYLRDFNGVHPTFLMTLLRIADYLQIQPDRAPKPALKLTKLKSPLSEREWRVHNCIRNISSAHEDPEAITIDARPENAEDFARLRQWLEGIQVELDVSWASLGEIYGRYKVLDQLKLSLRRIRSNTDDVNAFSAEVNFIPEVIKFDTAGADLLKLLINPLYGGNKILGIRELVQNSIDAVKELSHIKKRTNEAYSGVVEVNITSDEDGNPEHIEIHDNGIGINENILKNYFLKAGASFRSSEDWRATFENSTSGSEISRSGKFGVGALAIFLLGDDFELTSRRFDVPPNQSICFSAALEDEYIDIRRTTREVGTSIKVKLNGESIKAISYLNKVRANWYWMKEPKVTGSLIQDNKLDDSNYLPAEGELKKDYWLNIDNTTFSAS
jgi:hypothetical protein